MPFPPLLRFEPPSRRFAYPLFGLAISLGSPLGLIVVRACLAHEPPSAEWLARELRSLPEVYGYMTISTSLVFALLGGVVGSMHDALKLLSLTDPLTGLGNRRRLHERAIAEVSRSVRYRAPLSLLLIDVDGLKRINDEGGHKAGDVALRAVASALAKTCRRTDLATRQGGDEFAILATSTSARDAAELAERFRRLLAATPGAPTVSIGIADLDLAGARSAEALYAAADAALYEAKNGGRDRVSLAALDLGEKALLDKHAALGRTPFGALGRAPTGMWKIRDLRP